MATNGKAISIQTNGGIYSWTADGHALVGTLEHGTNEWTQHRAKALDMPGAPSHAVSLGARTYLFDTDGKAYQLTGGTDARNATEDDPRGFYPLQRVEGLDLDPVAAEKRIRAVLLERKKLELEREREEQAIRERNRAAAEAIVAEAKAAEVEAKKRQKQLETEAAALASAAGEFAQ